MNEDQYCVEVRKVLDDHFSIMKERLQATFMRCQIKLMRLLLVCM